LEKKNSISVLMKNNILDAKATAKLNQLESVIDPLKISTKKDDVLMQTKEVTPII